MPRLEAALLRRPWSSFREPTILETGEDLMLLEYVPHGPVLDIAEYGATVGRALAEIHAISFDQAGFLTPELAVEQPFPDLVTTLIDYARSVVPAAAKALAHELAGRVLDTLESNAPALRAVVGQPVLLHADFKASNLHWASDDRLLVLDWEFAYAGSRLSDIGQLLRFSPNEAFVGAFAQSYVDAGGVLPPNFLEWAALLDVVTLIGLVTDPSSTHSEPRVRDVRERVEHTLALA